MSGGSVCVVGSFMMDFVLRAPRRPMAGETLIGTSVEMFLGGKGFNQAIAASRAGADVTMVGRLGDDQFGRQFLAALRTEGIDATHVVVDDTVGTGVGAPLVDESGENSIVIVPRANDRLSASDVEQARAGIATADVVLLQLELPLDTVLTAARIAQESGTVVVLNPAPAPPNELIARFRGLVDVLVPNEVETRALCGAGDIDGDPSAAAALRTRLGMPVVMTRGGRGCLVDDGCDQIVVPAHRVPVVDSVGAGDAFCGALGRCLSAGASLLHAVAYANAAGALAVTRAGAEPAMPTWEAIVALAGASGNGLSEIKAQERYVAP
jgi:ribokinase